MPVDNEIDLDEGKIFLEDKWYKVNELKALTKAGMGACGGKTCTSLINRIFREEGINQEDIIPGTTRPLFIEVPFGAFAGIKTKKGGN